MAGFGSREAQGNPDVTEEDFPGITEYRKECSVLDHTTVQHVVANYKSGSRNLLKFRAGVITHNNECDTDGGNPQTDPEGNMDVGDREYYIYRQSWSKYARKWKTSSKVVHLSEDRVSNIHQIYTTIRTPRCETGTKYRGVVKVDWVSDNGKHDNTKSYPSRSKKC